MSNQNQHTASRNHTTNHSRQTAHNHNHQASAYTDPNLKKDRFDEHDFALWKQVETYKIWKMLNNPETNHIDPKNPYHVVYNPYNPEQLEKEVIFFLFLFFFYLILHFNQIIILPVKGLRILT